jgi:hypothetical protein
MMSVAPLLIAFLLFQRQFVQSFMHAGIKSDLVAEFDKMSVNLWTTWNRMKIAHGPNSGIWGFRDLGI